MRPIRRYVILWYDGSATPKTSSCLTIRSEIHGFPPSAKEPVAKNTQLDYNPPIADGHDAAKLNHPANAKPPEAPERPSRPPAARSIVLRYPAPLTPDTKHQDKDEAAGSARLFSSSTSPATPRGLPGRKHRSMAAKARQMSSPDFSGPDSVFRPTKHLKLKRGEAPIGFIAISPQSRQSGRREVGKRPRRGHSTARRGDGTGFVGRRPPRSVGDHVGKGAV